MGVYVAVADGALKGLTPDPSWDVSGIRDMAGGVIAVALVLTVGAIVLGCISLLPGLAGTGMRSFGWNRLVAAVLVPFVIGAATTGGAWSADLFGSGGLHANRSATQAGGSGKTDLKDERGKGKDDLTDLVSQLGKDIVSAVGDAVRSAVKETVPNVWKWLTGSDGKGNVFQKAGGAASDLWKWLTGSDG